MSDSNNEAKGPLLAGIGGVALLGATGLAYWLTGDAVFAMIIVGGVLILVVLFTVLYAWNKRRLAKRGSAMADRISSSSNSSVSKTGQLAKLDAMRSEFEKGVAKFRDAGRNVYSTPWYVLVGESGCGKTAAISQSQLRFIPGLNEPLQGVGGTINMNWWFTRSAIILDTAGRLMFEDVQPGMTSEWSEFLKLLKIERKNCPINGILLMIPADSLLRDSSEDIEKKAGRIAQQFEHIQTSLGFRFPVFVVITKCDLINGFNPFFESIADPQEQHQMLGWSNPESLDTDFNPADVEEHLNTISSRLVRRRTRLLMEPVGAESGRRIDQMDALFNLPESIEKLAPRLRQYLETIFVAGAWSQRPLFVRGIYLTCSLQQGSPYDPDLAGAMGVSVADLPKERAWDRKRSYFLRDVFNEKVFPEKGLVTRVRNVTNYQRSRRIIAMSAAAVFVLILLGFTWWSAQGFSETLRKPAEFWSNTGRQIAEKNDDQVCLVQYIPGAKDPYLSAYDSGDCSQKLQNRDSLFPTSSPSEESAIRPSVLEYSRGLAEANVDIPLMFRWASPTGSGLIQKIKSGHRALFERTVLLPVIEVAVARINSEKEWPPAAVAALRELTRIGSATEKPEKSSGTDRETPLDLDALLRYALGETAYKNADASGLPKVVRDEFAKIYETDGEWRTRAKVLYPALVARAVESGINSYLSEDRLARSRNDFTIRFAELASAVKTFEDAEKTPPAVKPAPCASLSDFEVWRRDWNNWFVELSKRQMALVSALRSIPELERDTDIKKLYGEKVDAWVGAMTAEHQEVLRWLDGRPVHKDSRERVTALIKAFKERNEQGQIARGDLVSRLGKVSPSLMSRGAGERPFVVRYTFFERVQDGLAQADQIGKPDFAKVLNPGFAPPTPELSDDAKVSAGDDPRLKDAKGYSKSAGENMVRPYYRYKWVSAVVGSMESAVEALDVPATQPVKFKPVKFDGRAKVKDETPLYDARRVAAVKKLIGNVDLQLKSDESALPILERDTLLDDFKKSRIRCDTWVKAGEDYWKSEVMQYLQVNPALLGKNPWEAYRGLLRTVQEGAFRLSLDQCAHQIDLARADLDNIPAPQPAQLDPQVLRMLDAWQSLSDKPEEARREILRMPFADFKDKFVYRSTRDDAATVFWVSVAHAGVEILANYTEKDLAPGYVEKKLKRFPLYYDVNGVMQEDDLTMDEVKLARGAVEDFATDGFGRGWSGVKEKPLERLLGRSAFDDDYLGWLNSTRRLLRALPEAGTQLGVSLVLQRCPATWEYEWISVDLNGVLIDGMKGLQKTTSIKAEGLKFDLPTEWTGKMSVKVGRSNEDSNTAQEYSAGKPTSTWAPLIFLLEHESQRDAKTGEWVLNMGSGKEQLVLRASISGNKDSWPAKKEWPGPAKKK